ncbi:MAG: DUF924 family protein [Hyphomicrobiales bacterium]
MLAAGAEAFDVLEFWWRAGPSRWFSRSDGFDAEIADRFGALHARAVAGDLDDWQATPSGALALVLLLDQFSRNLFRDDARAFAADGKALALAEAALARGFDRAFPKPARNFFYMPFMHAEDIELQERSVDLFRALGDKDGEYFALVHLDVIRRFGRFPHRNAALGRTTSAAEEAFLAGGGFSA